ncbi:hypothetical protein NKG05_10895 [Oerskovia sp. M15]
MAHHARRWGAVAPGPQQFVKGAKPDFVLTAGQPGIPPVAIFTDGWRYHASPSHDRVADDAAKRRNLRDAGYQVISLTWADLDGAEKPSESPCPCRGSRPGARPWCSRTLTAPSRRPRSTSCSATPGALARLAPGAAPAAREALARWLPLLAVGKAQVSGAAPAGTRSRTSPSACSTATACLPVTP